jgi:hypothetical protein
VRCHSGIVSRLMTVEALTNLDLKQCLVCLMLWGAMCLIVFVPAVAFSVWASCCFPVGLS